MRKWYYLFILFFIVLFMVTCTETETGKDENVSVVYGDTVYYYTTNREYENKLPKTIKD